MKNVMLRAICWLVFGLSMADAAVDFNSLSNAVVTGYQGWHWATGDGSPYNKWNHWVTNTSYRPGPTNCHMDMFPDMTEYTKQYDTDFYTPEGTRMKVFSAVDYSTVDLHFKWMRDYNIDSAFVQRFVSRFKGGYTTQGQNTDIVLSNACKAAEAYGRSFVVMYDVSDQNWSNDATLYITLTNDWISRAKQYTNSPNYQHHKGKPLAVVWGMGNTDRFPASPKVALDIVNFFKTNGCTVMGGVDKNWRTLSSGHRTNVDAGVTWSNVNNSYDVISPWLVGSFGAGTNGADSIKSLLSNDVVNCNSRGVDYMPVVFPGFSWANWQDGAGDEFNSRPRLGGNYLWRQAYNAKMAGAKMLYLAMFDEVDESTALFKTTDMEETSPQVISTPTHTNRWVRQDIDGYSLPSDWYLQVCGEINRMFKGQRSTVKDIPFVLNTRPVITSTPVTSADAGLLYSYAFTATDAQTNVVNYSAVSLPAWLTFNTNTAVLSGTPTVNDVGFYSVTLRASDMYGRTNQSFMIRVGTVGNDLPSITSTPGTRAMENQLYSYTVSAIDLDGDTLSYSAPIKPSWLSFNPTTRVLSGTPSSSALGLNPVSLTVYDGKSTVTQQFNVAVFAASVWSNLVQNGSFEAGSTTPTSWTVGSNSTRSAENVQDGFSALKLTTSPGNTTQVIPLQTNTNYKLSFWLNAGGMTSGGIRFDTNDKFDQGTVPGGTCQFTIRLGQALTWTNYTGTFNSSNQTSVTLRIYQGSMVGTVYFDNVILEVAGTSNNPPLVTSVPVTQGTQDKAYTYTLLAADAESSSLTLSGVTVPSWLSFNTTNGVLSGTPSLAHVGTHPVSLRVSDGVNAIVHSFSITVAAKASVPVTVPDVVGMAQNAARLMITNADLVTGTISSNYSTIIPAGSVISQNPTSGVVVASGSSVDLVISQGPRMVTTPDVVGQTQSAAQSSITSADLTVGTISQASSETVPAGSVISQNPAGGSIVAEGSAVALTVSSGYPSLTTNTWTSTGSSFWTNNAGWSGGAAPIRQTQNMRVVFNVTGTAECILNTAAVVAQLSMGDNGTISNNFLRLKSGADLYCGINPTNGTVWTAIGYNRSATATVETGAVLRTAANMLIGFSGTNTSHLNIQGGTVNSASTITLGHTNNLARGFITIDVGGLLTASGFTINNTGCVVDVRGGTIVLNGNLTNTVNGYIAAGTLKAYGGSSTLNVDYNTINTGKTTISAVTLVTVPNVVNQAEATARTSITGTGLVVGTVTSNYSMTVAAGNVISQTPAGSTSIAIGSSVNFEVSLGVQMVTVPNVVNQAQAAARTSITNAGLVVGTVTSNYSMTVAAGNVISF
ncbi:MAG: PASTA domain-containing protein, partial [Kiritimatiellaceae bacterium]|nr:PASTA domain-containing protein [Kiritimatiellaceae bacterium]